MTTLPHASPATALAEARHLTHDFRLPNGRALRVIEEIDLAIRPDEVVALIGPSGCGKSTILRLLAGLLTPTAGQVLCEGRPLVGLHPGVALVFQGFALYPWLTVTGNIESVLRAAGLDATAARARAAWAIRLIGLAGFEGAYPRELSGGMKQRVGMARALSVNPQLLFMDEPFSQVDALTAESLRAEVIDIWLRHDSRLSSIVMVSHDIKEVVYMADRIVVLAANPGRIRTIVPNPLPRPRDYRAPELLALVDQLHDVITGHLLPETAEPPAAPPPAAPPAAGRALLAGAEPLPDATPGQIVGLIEYLDARHGREDLFRIAADTHMEFTRMIAVVKAAEMLEFVDTPKRQVVLDEAGHAFVKADAAGRQALWRAQLRRLGLFREIEAVLRRQPRQELEREFVRGLLALALPQEDDARVFDTFVQWARAGDLFEYEEATGKVRPG